MDAHSTQDRALLDIVRDPYHLPQDMRDPWARYRLEPRPPALPADSIAAAWPETPVFQNGPSQPSIGTSPRLMDGAGGELEQLLGGKRVVSNLQRPELLKHRIGVLAQTQDRSGNRPPPIQSPGMGCFLGSI